MKWWEEPLKASENKTSTSDYNILSLSLLCPQCSHRPQSKTSLVLVCLGAPVWFSQEDCFAEKTQTCFPSLFNGHAVLEIHVIFAVTTLKLCHSTFLFTNFKKSSSGSDQVFYFYVFKIPLEDNKKMVMQRFIRYPYCRCWVWRCPLKPTFDLNVCWQMEHWNGLESLWTDWCRLRAPFRANDLVQIEHL